MFDPWAGVARLADWAVAWNPHIRTGRCHFPSRTIHLNPRMRSALLRCVLTHELVHAERGPFPAWAREREEATVRREAARRLIGIRELGEAMAWSEHPAVVADLLWVDLPTLEARLEHLHPAERHYLRRRLADVHTP